MTTTCTGTCAVPPLVHAVPLLVLLLARMTVVAAAAAVPPGAGAVAATRDVDVLWRLLNADAPQLPAFARGAADAGGPAAMTTTCTITGSGVAVPRLEVALLLPRCSAEDGVWPRLRFNEVEGVITTGTGTATGTGSCSGVLRREGKGRCRAAAAAGSSRRAEAAAGGGQHSPTTTTCTGMHTIDAQVWSGSGGGGGGRQPAARAGAAAGVVITAAA